MCIANARHQDQFCPRRSIANPSVIAPEKNRRAGIAPNPETAGLLPPQWPATVPYGPAAFSPNKLPLKIFTPAWNGTPAPVFNRYKVYTP